MGFIGKLIGGIFAFLGRILGIGKSGYYMEAEALPAGASAPAKPAVESAKESAKAEPAKATANVEAAKAEAKAAKAETKAAKADLAPAPLETVKAAIAEAPASGPANGKTNGKKQRKAKAEAEKPAAPIKKAETATKTDQTFAPNYLIQTSGSRRRPGPSMDYFRNIAKQVKS